jgi:hypothetical protein
MVHDGQLARALEDDTKVLVLPWPDELDADQQRVVARFGESPDTTIISRNDFGEGSVHLIEGASRPPVQISGPPHMHATMFQDTGSGAMTVCLANSWGWFKSERVLDPESPLLFPNATPPEPCSGVEIILDATPGDGPKVRSVYGADGLTIKKDRGRTTVRIPAFQIFACVAIG